MSQPSNWPLPSGSSRLLLPQPLLAELRRHPLTRGLYPISYGHYLDAVGHRVRRHVHTDHLIIFCHGGRGRFQTAQHKGYLLPGQVLFLPKGVPHMYQSDSEHPWSIYWAHFAGSQVGEFMDYLGVSSDESSRSPVLTLKNWRALLGDVTQLLNLQHQRLTLEQGILSAALLRKLLSELPLLSRPSQPEKAGFDIEALDRFMRDNSHKTLQLDDFAEFTGLSRYHFSKKFRQVTGDSPIQYFTRMKMSHAAQMLREGEQTIRQISQTLGFDDPYYFSRLFKKHLGVAPRFYRQGESS
ncbi:MAG: AraC family transcriptional regulator [Idiomarina sp.]|nr:AraC family transcriptional regulator [Idiomarina sp.]